MTYYKQIKLKVTRPESVYLNYWQSNKNQIEDALYNDLSKNEKNLKLKEFVDFKIKEIIEAKNKVNASKYLIFDFDGVFGDSWNATVKAFMHLEKQENQEEVIKYLKTDRLVNPRYTKDRIYTDEETENLLKFREEEYNLKKQIGLGYFKEFVEEVKQYKNAKMAIVSTAYQPVLDEFAITSGLKFTHLEGFKANFSKETCIKNIARDWNVSLNQIVFFTDTIRDIKEASNLLAKEQIFGCSWGFHNQSELETILPKEQILVNFSDIHNKLARQIDVLTRQILALSDDNNLIEKKLHLALDEYLTKLIKDNLINNKRRVDGRLLTETRAISCQMNVLSEPHGSSLFSRGETQVLNTLTLGTLDQMQLTDNAEDENEVYLGYIHHYNFPAYSVGETGRYIGAGRREIGHGNLAQKALEPVLPNKDDFPYMIRTVSECLGSNGSTSMASTCASSLSLMTAGVPIKSHVAGVAMGLAINENGGYSVLTDIQGLEDHHADMDFKVTGTETGVTAIQLDNKVGGVTSLVLKETLKQAKEARQHILSIMNQTISSSNPNIHPKAPKVKIIIVPSDKMRDVIGPSGAVINGMQDKFKVKIDLENETGKCAIYSSKMEDVDACYKQIESIVKVYQTGDKVMAKIFRMENYGVFVKLDDGDKESMIHISNLKMARGVPPSTRYKISDVLQCEVAGFNDKGQMDLSLI